MNRYLISYRIGRRYYEEWATTHFLGLLFIDCLQYAVKPEMVRMWGKHPRTKRWGLLVNQ